MSGGAEEQVDAPAARRAGRRRRVLLAASAVALAMLVVVGAAAGWVLASERGARWALGFVLSDDLRVERVEGRLIGPLVLHGVESRSDGADLRVERLRLEWRAAELRRRTLHVDALELEGVEVRQKPVEPAEPEPFDLSDIRFPLRVELLRLRIAELTVWQPEAEEPLRIDEVLASASAAGSDLRLTDLRIAAPEYRASAVGDIVTAGDFPLHLQLAWAAAFADQPPLAGEGRITGALLGELRVDHTLLQPTAATLTARVSDPLRDLRWCAELRVPRFALRTVRDDLAAYQAGAEASACGGRESVDGRASFAGLAEEIGELAGELRIGFRDGRVRLDDVDLRLPGDGRLAARAEVELDGESPRFRVDGRWTDVGWPLTGAREYASRDGRFEASGTQERFRVALDADVRGSAVPAGRWRLSARGTPTGLTLDEVRGATLEGVITGSGTVSWGPELAWEIRAAADRLNPGAFLPDLPGLLGLDLTTRGTLRDGALRADVRLGRLDGTLRGIPLAVRSGVRLDGDRYGLETLEIVSGGSVIRAAGRLDRAWELDWEIDAPELADFAEVLPGVRGGLFARGSMRGPREQPSVTASFLAEGVEAGENRVGSALGTVLLDLSDREASRVHLRAEGIAAGTVVVDSVVVAGGGIQPDHTLGLTAFAGGDTLLVGLRGGVAGAGWSGALERLDLRTAAFGAWGLRAPAPLHLAADSARLPGLCWGSGAAEACLAGGWHAERGGQGEIRVVDLPLSLADAWLPEETRLEGTLALEGRGGVDAQGEVRASARLASGPGTLRFGPAGDGQPVRGYRALTADVSLDERAILADFAFHLEEGGEMTGRIHAPRDVPPEEQTLTGHLTGEIHDRGLLGMLLEDVAESDGVLRVELQPTGTLAAPGVRGRVAVTDARADLLALGVRLRETTLDAASDGGPLWTLTGGAASGPGRVALSGTLRLPESAEEGWGAEVRVEGERFEAFNTPLARVIASPRLTLRADAERIDLGGEVHVPRATITPERFEAVVPASEDVVIVGANGSADGAAAEPEPAVAIHTRVRVTLGDSVRLTGFGLDGRLTGALEVSDAPGRVTTGRGEIQVLDGTFSRFRQRLAIDRGRIIFADGPIDNPGLDIRVTRRTREVLAGMNVEGTVAVPQVTFFSDPGMAEADVLAYLLLGRPASLASQEEGQFLQNAAASAGMAGGRMLAGRLGSTLGLQDARIEGENLEQASLFLGTYLSPRLYVGYGIGLFDAANLLRIRYQLGRAWVLQTESGVETGADLLYTIER